MMFGYCLEKTGFGHSWNNQTVNFRSTCAILNYALCCTPRKHWHINKMSNIYCAKQKLNIYIFEER